MVADTPALENQNREYFAEWVVLNLLLYGLFVVMVGPITAVSAFIYNRKRSNQTKYDYVLLTASALWTLLIYKPVTNPILFQPLDLWFLSAPSFPIGGLILKGLIMFSYFTKPKTLREQLSDEEKSQKKRR